MTVPDTAGDTTGIGIAAGNLIDDLDGTYIDGFTLGQYTRVGGVQDGSQGATALTPGTVYYCALQRSGDDVLTYLGASPAAVAVENSEALPFGDRIAATQIVLNGWIQSIEHGQFTQLGRVRAYTTALTLAQIKAELASYSPVLATGLWADWPLVTAGDLTDHSGNGRHLTGIGVLGTGPALAGDIVSAPPGSLSAVQVVAVSASTLGDNTLVAAVTGKKIRVVSLALVATGGANTVRLGSAASGQAMTGAMDLPSDGQLVLPYNPAGWCETVAGDLLNLELSAATAVAGTLGYVTVG